MVTFQAPLTFRIVRKDQREAFVAGEVLVRGGGVAICDKEQVARMLREGRSHASIGIAAGVTRERVRQLANIMGLNERMRPRGEAEALAKTFWPALDYGPFCCDCGVSLKIAAPDDPVDTRKVTQHGGRILCEDCRKRRGILTAIRARLWMWKERGTRKDLNAAVYMIRKFNVTPDEFLPPQMR